MAQQRYTEPNSTEDRTPGIRDRKGSKVGAGRDEVRASPAFSLDDVRRFAREIGISFDKFTPETLQMGMDVEMEHGRGGRLDVTKGDGLATAKIALAHLEERPDYYERLEAVEGNAIIIPMALLWRIIVIAIVAIIIWVTITRFHTITGRPSMSAHPQI